MPTYLCHGFRWDRKSIRIFIIVQDIDDGAPEWIVAPSSSNSILETFYRIFDFIPEPREEHDDDDGFRRLKKDRQSVAPGRNGLSPLPPSTVPPEDDDVLQNSWSAVKLLEEYDPTNLTEASRPHAYVADHVVRIDLSASVAEEIAKYEERRAREPADQRAMGGDKGGSDEFGRTAHKKGSGKKAGWFEKLRDQLQNGEDIRWYVVVCGDEDRSLPEDIIARPEPPKRDIVPVIPIPVPPRMRSQSATQEAQVQRERSMSVTPSREVKRDRSSSATPNRASSATPSRDLPRGEPPTGPLPEPPRDRSSSAHRDTLRERSTSTASREPLREPFRDPLREHRPDPLREHPRDPRDLPRDPLREHPRDRSASASARDYQRDRSLSAASRDYANARLSLAQRNFGAGGPGSSSVSSSRDSTPVTYHPATFTHAPSLSREFVPIEFQPGGPLYLPPVPAKDFTPPPTLRARKSMDVGLRPKTPKGGLRRLFGRRQEEETP